MIFTSKSSFGVKNNYFLNSIKIGYVNFHKVKLNSGITAGSATSSSYSKKIALIKSYNEFLERFSLGIPLEKNRNINTVNIQNNFILNSEYDNFGYGQHKFGINDTTGTASGKHSVNILYKSVTEMLEKNEVFCFWYGESGKILYKDDFIRKSINECNFISDDIKVYFSNELSNSSTVIVLGFFKEKLITSGVSCNNNFLVALKSALEEAKVIEWQTFSNKLSSNHLITKQMFENIAKVVEDKENKYEVISKEDILNNNELKVVDWVKSIEFVIVGADISRGIKTIKCISEELLNCMPIKKNICDNHNKEIVRRYYLNSMVDCPIQ